MPAPHQKNKLHPQDQKNLLLFAVMFGVVYLLFDTYVLRPHMEKMGAYHDQVVQVKAEQGAGFRPPEFLPREEVIAENQRVTFAHDSLIGSVNLTGARLDDINLRHYYETMEKKRPIAVMSPEKTQFPRYAEFGWLDAGGKKDGMPNMQSLWKVKSQTPEKLTLVWDSPLGATFERDIEVTDNYLLKITQRVVNRSGSDLSLYPYSLIAEHGLPTRLIHRWIVHEGPIGFIGNKLEERKYQTMPETPTEDLAAQTGWVGFTEQYWLAALMPEQQSEKTFRFSYRPSDTADDTKSRYQVDVMSAVQNIPAGQTTEYVTYMFAGAKELKTLQKYGKELGVRDFDAAIDFGWFWFLTKPFFTVILMINGVVGHFATTMLIFAFLLRLSIFPLATTSYKSFAKLRIITPRIVEIKEQFKEDKAGMQKAMMELYQKEKVNPAAGCLPILIQIPIFFSLYKVLNVAIEMRHAPGFLWIKDLSAPDPTSLFNLFGLLPYDVPSFLMIGAWPCLMVLTLLIQKSMNPPPTDPVMRDMFRLMPYFMGFVMSQFAAGLIIYWTFSNFLSGLQQYTIMRMMGVDVKLFQGWFGRKYQDNVPDVHRLGFTEETVKEHKERLGGKKPEKESDPEGRGETDGASGDSAGDDGPSASVTPPKPRRKKKK
ncbi:MAG: membrane protein insertase YidC [Rhodospirillales bacterium]|nr:membrane protein insertase YidC [Rhodospirillales bacterium]